MTSAESVIGAGKLWLDEDDTRTYLSGTTDYGGLADLAGTRSAMRRNTAQAAIRGFGTWWMDLPAEGWFADPKIWEEMRLLRPVDEALLERARPFAPEIAAVVDEDSMCHLAGGSGTAGNSLIYEGRHALGRVGAPYGQYMLSDVLAGRVGAKVQVFLSAWALPPESRAALRSRRRADEVRVWVWAPGYIRPDRADATAVEEVTGFRCRAVTPTAGAATPSEAGRGMGLDRPLPFDPAVRPLFAVEAAPGETLATYADGSPAVALRRGAAGIDVFVGPPRLTPDLLRALARLAGVHLYTDVDCAVWAAEDFISIHALADGPLAVRTGRDSRVTDALTGAEVGKGPRILLEIGKGETRVLRR